MEAHGKIAQPQTEIEKQLVKIPLFAKLKPKIFETLSSDLRFEVREGNSVLVRQGEYSSDFFVVLEGLATAYRTEEDGKVFDLGTHGAGDWFGEMPALSNQPQFATVKTDGRCVLLVLDAPTFKTLYKGGGSFVELIDSRYRERALSVHLRSAPLFKGLSKTTLGAIAKGAELLSFDEDTRIAEQGKEADAVYLVRSGIVKKLRKLPNGLEETQAYLCDNSSFGEQLLSSDRRWNASFVAMTRVDLVKVDSVLFSKIFQSEKDTAARLQKIAMTLLAEESGIVPVTKSESSQAVGEMPAAMIELMVDKQAVKGGEALVIDLKRCTRCNACVESCVAVHEDRVPRLSKRGIRTGDQVLTSACYNCKVPECMLSCNYGAIRRDLNGSIHFIFDNCTGCTACELKCPYGVIRMTNMVSPEDLEKETKSFFSRFPVIGKFFSKSNAPETPISEATKPEKKAIKCDLCSGLPFEACVYNCPCNAIHRVSPEDLAATWRSL